jgi:hypothetical protein
MERETYRGAIDQVENNKVRSAVGLRWRPCLSNGGGRCQCGYLGALPRPLHVPYDRRPMNTSCDSLGGESRVGAIGSNRLLAIPLNLLGRNAKTRWGEPAGLELYGHVAVTDSMEAASWTRNLALFWEVPGNHGKHW